MIGERNLILLINFQSIIIKSLKIIIQKAIPYANKFIIELNIDIAQVNTQKLEEHLSEDIAPTIQNNNSINNVNNLKVNQSSTEKNILDIRDFKLGKVTGDRNCTLRAILKGASLDENKHSLLRETLTEVIRENKFEQHTLDANGFLSKQDLIDFVSTLGEYIGMEIVAFLLENYNILG